MPCRDTIIPPYTANRSVVQFQNKSAMQSLIGRNLMGKKVRVPYRTGYFLPQVMKILGEQSAHLSFLSLQCRKVLLSGSLTEPKYLQRPTKLINKQVIMSRYGATSNGTVKLQEKQINLHLWFNFQIMCFKVIHLFFT